MSRVYKFIYLFIICLKRFESLFIDINIFIYRYIIQKIVHFVIFFFFFPVFLLIKGITFIWIYWIHLKYTESQRYTGLKINGWIYNN